MALRPLFPNGRPVGAYDALDAERTTILGGEVAGFAYLSITGTDVATSDVDDGYTGITNLRPALTVTLASGMRPLFLTDEGTTYYGTLFGTVVGSAAGAVVTGGTAIGPHTAHGSGKWTVWGAEGLYAVTLDAVSQVHNTGLVSHNPTLGGNDQLYATSAGLLTPNVSAAFESVVLGRFIEFTSDGSLVSTTRNMVQALNSPTGASAPGANFTQAVFYWNPEL
jgi:hypothetical protein